MSVYKWLIDAGHGGIINGKYITAPAKMHRFEDGLTIYEGVINRQISKLVYDVLDKLGIDFALVYDEHRDTKLSERVSIANKVYAKDKRCVYLSIHSNAGGGQGFEVFTSPGQTNSDLVADIFCNNYIKLLPQFKFRPGIADGDLDKEEKFYVLVETKCPAILVENLFFDSRIEAEFLNSQKGQELIAGCIIASIVECEKTKPI